ncbi:MAG: amidohydrolase [Chloroflexi bacterium]|nr:amidohydrolase [Chloroflexota bacterium]
MLIVDAQIHLWRHGPPTTPTHRQVTAFTADEALAGMDAAGVDAAIIHPPGWDPTANDLAIAAVRQHPTRFAILGSLPLDQPASRARLATWRDQPGLLGLRFTFLQPHQRSWPLDGTIDWLWPAAERAGVPIALLAPHFLPIVGQVAARHPGLRLIVDHLGGGGGTTPAKDAAAFAHLPGLLALARYPNIAVKATGAPGYASGPYPFASLHPFLRQIYDSFGPARLFWGTDISRMPCSWRQCVTLFTEELPWLTAADKDLIMGRAVCDWLGWQPAGSVAGAGDVQ